ncbi:MAG: M1 family metallopeptidase [Holophagaceae bacterium]
MPRALSTSLLALTLAAGGGVPAPAQTSEAASDQASRRPMPLAPRGTRRGVQAEGGAQDRPMPLGPLRRTWDTARDVHSAANPAQIRVTRLDLDLKADFAARTLQGTVVLTLDRAKPEFTTLLLDTRGLEVLGVEASRDGKAWTKAAYQLNGETPVLGSALQITAPEGHDRIRVAYRTRPSASGLQWLAPAQTAGKKHPFMFTQSQAIHARSWVPCQDSPGLKVTFTARIRTPKGLRAVMGATNPAPGPRTGDYRFTMEKPIPAYLLALAIGDLDFRPLGKRTGVYAEPSVLPAAAKELADTERMVAAAEKLYGPYAWGRYDLLVLPPSFPFGGMENPRLTFATPTILAGDKSLVSLVAHELAHSWSGNLVTNATWRDFWLNEGFTTYVERRVVEAVYGKDRADMEAVLGYNTLLEGLKTLPPRDQVLHIDLAGRDPDDGSTDIPYEKGSLFLSLLERTFGRPAFDAWLKGWFARGAFQSRTTADLEADLEANLLKTDPAKAEGLHLAEWLRAPGLPDNAPKPASRAFADVERLSSAWVAGTLKTADLPARAWSTQEWLHFLEALPADLGLVRMQELDQAFRLTSQGNAEIAHRWLLLAIKRGYEPAYPRLEQYLVAIGRRKLITPLYEELARTPEGKLRAIDIYRKARPGYHPIAQASLDPLLGWKP